MATIKELSYLLLDQVNGGIPTDDSKINYRIAEAYIRNAVAFHIRRKWFEEKNNSDEHYVGKSISKQQTVQLDEERGLYYVDKLGESLDMGGMRSYTITPVRTTSRWTHRFVPVTLNELNIQIGLSNVPNIIQFYELDNKLYFTNGDVSQMEKVTLSQSNLLPLDKDDSVPDDIAAPAQEYAYRLAYQEIVIQSDRVNDGVPNLN